MMHCQKNIKFYQKDERAMLMNIQSSKFLRSSDYYYYYSASRILLFWRSTNAVLNAVFFLLWRRASFWQLRL